MYIKNHKSRARLVNGTLGVVASWKPDDVDPEYMHPVVDFEGVGSVAVEDEVFSIDSQDRPGDPMAQRIQVSRGVGR